MKKSGYIYSGCVHAVVAEFVICDLILLILLYLVVFTVPMPPIQLEFGVFGTTLQVENRK